MDFLSTAEAHGGAAPVRRIETHGAVVFLSGASAIKLKRAVRFDYMDYSTVARRRAALRGGDSHQPSDRAVDLSAGEGNRAPARRTGCVGWSGRGCGLGRLHGEVRRDPGLRRARAAPSARGRAGRRAGRCGGPVSRGRRAHAGVRRARGDRGGGRGERGRAGALSRPLRPGGGLGSRGGGTRRSGGAGFATRTPAPGRPRAALPRRPAPAQRMPGRRGSRPCSTRSSSASASRASTSSTTWRFCSWTSGTAG